MTAVTLVSAGLSEPSSTRMLGDRLAEATVRSLGEQGIHADVTVVELRPLAHDIADHMLTHVPSSQLTAAIDAVTGADALIAVSPTFTMSYSGLFKSFFDVIEEGDLTGVPVAIGATGGSARHSMVVDHAMRPLFSYLKGVVAPTAVYAASEDWGADAGLDRRIARAGAELAQLVVAMPRHRAADPFDADGDGFVSFEQLLGDAS